MDCKQTEKVSALMDGELSNEAEEALREHIEACEECASAESDFLFMRQQIRGLAVDEQTAAPVRSSFFRRRITIPAPVFAVALLVIAGLFAVLFVNRTQLSAGTAAPKSETAGANEASLARFDGGGKAQIYKEAK